MNHIDKIIYVFLISLILACNISTKEAESEKKQPTEKTETMHIKKMASYNTWANQQLVDWLSQATEEEWDREVASSFSSLNLTTRHLWNAEYGWLTSLKREDWSRAIEMNESISMISVLNGFMETTKDFEAHVQHMNTADLSELRNFGSGKKQVSCLEIIQHVFNHATYHRGQLITLGRQVGLQNPPRTDFIHFLTIE